MTKSLGNGNFTKLFIEEIDYQQSLIEHLAANNVPAEGVTVAGQDK